MPFGYGLHDKLKGHEIIRSDQSFIIAEINLMLGRGNLMMRREYLKSHLLQCEHHIPPGIFPEVNRSHIKIPALLVGQGGGKSVLIRVEKEKLTLRSRVQRIAHLCRSCHCLFEHISWISLIGRPILPVYIADQPCHLPLLGAPRKNLKGTQIRAQVHIRITFS